MDYGRQYGEITGPKVGCVGKTDLELELPFLHRLGRE